MADPILAHLRDELIRVMHENAETLREEASVSPSEETLAQQERSLALVRVLKEPDPGIRLLLDSTFISHPRC